MAALLLRPLLNMVAIATPSGTERSCGSASMLAQQQQQQQRGEPLIDFGDPQTALEFMAVDDRIMGGSSTSRVVHDATEGASCFQGNLIVEGGGFASVRYLKTFTLPTDCEALSLTAAGDGRLGYKITLQSEGAAQGVSYQYLLPLASDDDGNTASDLASGDGFTSMRIPLSAFKPSLRGRPAPDAPPLRAAEVRGLGLMLSRYEVAGSGVKESIAPGPFRLRLRRLATAESELAINGRRWVQAPAGNGA